ncbi:energy transducer TonB [Pseudoalteromonas xiamenensis]
MKSNVSKQVQQRAVAASLVLVAALMMLLKGVQLLQSEVEPTYTVREVELALPLPPPPPPPPAAEQPQQSQMLALAVPGAGASLPITLDLTAPSLDVTIETPQLSITDPQWQDVVVDWQAVNLDSLDGLPSLLTPLRVVFPKSLVNQGVKTVLVKLDVVIDEQGAVTLVSVVSNPYPELKPQIDKLVKQSRFTAPKQNQQAVRARFVWPIELTQ